MEDEERYLARLLRFSQWAGIAPYQTLHNLRISRGFALYGRLIFVFSGLYETFRWTKNLLHPKLSMLMPVTTLVCMLGILYHGMFNASRRIRRIIVLMRHLKKMRREIGRMRKPEAAQRQACVLFIFIQISTILLTVVSLSSLPVHTNEFTLHAFAVMNATLLLLLTNTVTMQFVLVAMSINSSFCIINDRLEEMLVDAQTHEQKRNERKNHIDFKGALSTINMTVDMFGNINEDYKPHKKLRVLAQAYVTTCDMVRQQNDSDKALLLLLFVNIIGNMVLTVNNLVSSIQANESNYTLFMAIEMIWYILNVCRAMLLAAPSHAISSERGRSRTLLCMLMYTVRSREEPLLDEVEEFLLHLKLNQPSYGALGIFNMNRRLVVTMIAVGTTYLATIQGF